jgi:hypothetical protein
VLGGVVVRDQHTNALVVYTTLMCAKEGLTHVKNTDVFLGSYERYSPNSQIVVYETSGFGSAQPFITTGMVDGPIALHGFGCEELLHKSNFVPYDGIDTITVRYCEAGTGGGAILNQDNELVGIGVDYDILKTDTGEWVDVVYFETL